MVSEKVAKVFVLVINYFFLTACSLSLLGMITTADNTYAGKEVNRQCISYIISCLIALAGCYGAHKSNTCMLTTNGILYIIFSSLGLIMGIVMLVTATPDMKVYTLIIFAGVAIQMTGGIFAIYLSQCIKSKDKEQFQKIEVCTEE